MSLRKVLIPAFARIRGGGEPGEPEHPIDPGDPDYPESPDYPDVGLPRPPIGNRPPGINPRPPIGNRPPGPGEVPPVPEKPVGVRVLPMDPEWEAPADPPQPPGVWLVVNAGRRQPPAWGFVPTNVGLPEGPPSRPTRPGPEGGQPPGVPPSRPSRPAPAGGADATGHWLPIKPLGPQAIDEESDPEASDFEPDWVWVPHIGPEFGVKIKPEVVPVRR